LDAKGRLAIPARFREVLDKAEDDCLVITSHKNCLWAYTRKDWQIVEQKALQLSEHDLAAIAYFDFFISGAQECPLKNGRVTIPLELREEAKLQREVVLVGQLKKFTIWDKDRWQEAFARAKEEFPKASQSLAAMGL
jgi:MraZ protein